MLFRYNDCDYEVIIEKKRTTKNTYIRVKSDMKIYVTTNILSSNRMIEKLIRDERNTIIKMIERETIKNKNNEDFNYLGNKYKIVYVDDNILEIGEKSVFMSKNIDVDKWYKKQAKKIFLEHLDNIYNDFSRSIPYPKLRIRKMTTRWGVCNTKDIVVTLNLELIKRDTKYLDYVIVHELSHLIHHNHSKAFWELVYENYPNYKKVRNEMKLF